MQVMRIASHLHVLQKIKFHMVEALTVLELLICLHFGFANI